MARFDFPALKPQLQSAIASFGNEGIRSFDDLLDSTELMERIALALDRRELIHDTLNYLKLEPTFKDKLNMIENSLAHINYLETERKER
jgi:hypothetical protein